MFGQRRRNLEHYFRKILGLISLGFALMQMTFVLAIGKAIAETTFRPPQVMILNSYHQGFLWTDDVVSAIITTMSARLPNVELHVEYMDSKRYLGEQFNEALLHEFTLKYRKLQPDIIITSDDAALEFIQRHHQQLFPQVPVVFCGVNSVSNALSVDRNYFTGLIEALDISDNITLAQRLLPGLKEIVIVSDGTPTGLGTRQMAKEAEHDHRDLTFIFLNGEDLSTDEMLNRLRQLPPKTSAVIVPAWYLDRDGITFDNKTIYPRISQASSVPVFGTSSANLGYGIVGGKLNSGTTQGEFAARQALRILTGEATARDIPVETASQNRYMFDYRQLSRFKIARDLLPPDAIILNRAIPFYERYRTETTVIAISFLLLVIIIAMLMWNISLRRKVELGLRESEERFRTLHNASFGGIIIHDKGKILDCNQGLGAMTGYSFDELIGMEGIRLIAPEWRGIVINNIQEGYEQPYEAEGMRKDGTIFPLRIYGKHIPYKGRTAQVFEFRDITLLKQAENERLNLETQLQQARKIESIGQLAGGVAHDFNNMLTAILGNVEIAMMRCQPSDQVLTNLRGINEAAHRSADLVKQLLTFARKQTISPHVLDINQMSATILKMLHRVIGEGITLSWLPADKLWKIRMDPSQLDQLLVNLCVNSRDAINGIGRIVIETENVMIDENYCKANMNGSPGEYVMLAVSDNGCGMSRDLQVQIFEPFFTTKGIGKGTGLGLSTVYGIIKQNGGFINLYSEVGKGTIFRIYLPRAVGEDTIDQEEDISKTPKGNGQTVLMVEDEAVIRDVISIMLTELGYNVLIAGTPREALNLAQQHSDTIQLIVTDMIMPEMNGCELTVKIRQIVPEVKCLYMSGYAANAIAHHGVLEENVNFLSKPFSIDELGMKVFQTLMQNDSRRKKSPGVGQP